MSSRGPSDRSRVPDGLTVEHTPQGATYRWVSTPDLMSLKARWLADLGREGASAA